MPVKTVKAKIDLCESEIKDILAEYLGVEPSDILFIITTGQHDNYIMSCTVFKNMDVSALKKTEAPLNKERKQLYYE